MLRVLRIFQSSHLPFFTAFHSFSADCLSWRSCTVVGQIRSPQNVFHMWNSPPASHQENKSPSVAKVVTTSTRLHLSFVVSQNASKRVSGRRCAHHPDVPQGVHKRRDIWPCSGSERNQYPAGYLVCTGQPGQLHSHQILCVVAETFPTLESTHSIKNSTNETNYKKNTKTLMIQTIRRFQFQNLRSFAIHTIDFIDFSEIP